MNELGEKALQEELDWVRRRTDALARIEAKLLQMRELAIYAAGQNLNESEAIQVQEWINILQSEINDIDKATARNSRDTLAH